MNDDRERLKMSVCARCGDGHYLETGRQIIWTVEKKDGLMLAELYFTLLDNPAGAFCHYCNNVVQMEPRP
ncbi:MAG: hypothetical protein ACRD4B_10990 [Acidobacteriota bacterium]